MNWLITLPRVLIQFILLTIASIAIGIIAFNRVSPDALYQSVPDGWFDLSFGWELDLNWNELIPAANSQIASDGWNLFTIFFILNKSSLGSTGFPR